MRRHSSIRPAYPLAVLVLPLLACSAGSPTPMLRITFPDGTFLGYQALDASGAPTALQVTPAVDANTRTGFSQEFSVPGSSDPRAHATFWYGQWNRAVGPPMFALGPGNGVLAGPDMEDLRFEVTFTDVTWVGDPERPFTLTAKLNDQNPGTVTIAPRCAKSGAVSNVGCGFVPPEGATTGTIEWPGAPNVRTVAGDGCPGDAMYSDAFTGAAWTWTGDTLDLGAGRKLACVTTGTGGVVCHDQRHMNLSKDINGIDCGWTVTTLAYPEFTGAAPTDHPRFWVAASMNDQSVTTGCYGFNWCTLGF